MTPRRTAVYVVSVAATATGLWMMFGRTATPSVPAAPSASLVVKSEPTDKGGYMGSGRAQVTLETAANTVAAPARNEENREVGSPRHVDGDRRMEELKRVLENIEGEPVYVEGVDGPAPAKKKRK